jgi:hypothetical protein
MGLQISHRINVLNLFYFYTFLHLLRSETLIIYDNSALQAELLIYKGDLSVKSNSYLITLKGVKQYI